VILSVALGVALEVIFSRTASAGWTWSRAVGYALAIPSLALWVMARVELGKSFSVAARAKELKTQGLYSKIRNPVYVFGTIFIAGFVLAIGRPMGLLILLVIVPMQVLRARKEARVLEEKFGDAYREYRSKTWF
jgi:protein-S-isoprenylcysteine O-methyltransferase Ste14